MLSFSLSFSFLIFSLIFGGYRGGLRSLSVGLLPRVLALILPPVTDLDDVAGEDADLVVLSALGLRPGKEVHGDLEQAGDLLVGVADALAYADLPLLCVISGQ